MYSTYTIKEPYRNNKRALSEYQLVQYVPLQHWDIVWKWVISIPRHFTHPFSPSLPLSFWSSLILSPLNVFHSPTYFLLLYLVRSFPLFHSSFSLSLPLSFSSSHYLPSHCLFLPLLRCLISLAFPSFPLSPPFPRSHPSFITLIYFSPIPSPGVRFTNQFGGKTAPKVCNKVIKFWGKVSTPKPFVKRTPGVNNCSIQLITV